MPQNPPQRSSPSQPEPGGDEFEQALAELEENLQLLKDRYEQIQRDRLRQEELQQQRQQIKNSDPQEGNRQILKAELKHIQEQLEILELNLESRLFSWHSLKEPFWQAVRFGGLGIVIGWILKSYAG